MRKTEIVIVEETIARKIFLIRGRKVMLDRDLAELYKVETRILNQAVRRNPDRFPGDFMFQLTKTETQDWISQFVISNKEKMGIRKYPLAFTEQGVAMLSGILNSKKAIQVNIQIMRTFTRLREMVMSYKELKEKIELMEGKYDKQFRTVFEAMKQLIEPGEPRKLEIGFRPKI